MLEDRQRLSKPVYALLVGSILVAILSILILYHFFHGYVYDDSYIAFRFSENWATGRGLTWNPGEDPVEGFTSFAWVLLGAFFQRVFGIPPHIVMPFVGIASLFFWVAFVLPLTINIVLFQRSSSGIISCLLGVYTILTLALNSSLGFHAFHGLETALHILVFALLVYFSLNTVTVGSVATLTVMSLVSIMVRPDALAFVFPLWGLLVIYSSSKDERYNSCVGFLVFVVALGTYSIIKWQYFGYPFPNTFYIKQGGLLSGLGYVKEYLIILSPLWLFMAFAGGRSSISNLIRDKTFILLLIPSSIFCIAYIELNPILGDAYRFLIPTLPMFILACLRAYALSNTELDREESLKWKPPDFLTEQFAIYLIVTFLVSVLFNFRMYRKYDGLASSFGRIERTLVRAGHNLREASSLSPPPLLATGDIGAIPYFSKLPTMDIIGLADEQVAHQGLTHEYILKRNPDLLVLQDLYLTETVRGEGADPGDYPSVAIQIGEVTSMLDVPRYERILHAPERAHSGAGSTFQVVTTPSFTSNYIHITDWEFGSDRYYVFVRNDYPHYDELVRILQGNQ